MIEPLKKTPFSHSLRHKRVILNFANADFTEKLWKTIEQDKKDRDAIWDWIKKSDDVGEYLADASKENPGQEVVFIISTDDAPWPTVGSSHPEIQNLIFRD